MTDHTPTRRTMRQRERKAVASRCAQAVRDYNREGIDAAVKALGGGDEGHWPQTTGEYATPVAGKMEGLRDE